MKKIVVYGLALVLAIGSMAYVFVALFDDSDSSSSTASSSTATAPTTSTTRVEFTGEGAEAFCAADARLNQELAQQAPTTNDAASLKADYERRVSAVNELEQVAPPEIKADVETIGGVYDKLSSVLSAAGYDLSKVSQADRAASQGPEVTAAGQRLAQYTERVCKATPQP